MSFCRYYLQFGYNDSIASAFLKVETLLGYASETCLKCGHIVISITTLKT
ncbi:hypothetical protein MtrunA17_Chr2g0307441 [Medicago truncatula]|uniref:Uncharacterized protein n=1 Tax=Medicago truncatula TaxID=3880 RepID=A0A396JAW7_MEDTR|nr:hypothetical protein MtrunA17_Chr2g0307441 [Medicago truncatula]